MNSRQIFTAAPKKGPQPTLLMHIPVSRRPVSNGEVVFTMEFSTLIQTEQQEGLYELYFHNCRFQGGSTKKALQVTGEVILFYHYFSLPDAFQWFMFVVLLSFTEMKINCMKHVLEPALINKYTGKVLLFFSFKKVINGSYNISKNSKCLNNKWTDEKQS